jgi:protocatechuate 3,4-dioxygenase, beta subunit
MSERMNRRVLLGTTLVGSAFYATRGLFAEELTRTPPQTEGPFYPDHLPLDRDNDLIIVNNGVTPAVGEVTHFFGRIFDAKGEPVKGAVIEIWQVDNNGAYLHSKDPQRAKRDANFQGYGKFETGTPGDYRFRTIKPVPYPMRTPHIHVKVSKGGKELLTTQAYVKGHPGNERDFIYSSIKDPKALAAITVDFAAKKNSKIGELVAKFDIVLGVTPEG